MSSSRSQAIPVTCPSCKQPFTATVYSVIDAVAEPDLKWQLLSGKLNIARCPHCGMAGILGMPFAYHDPEKELLYVFVPVEAGLKGDEQQRLIGGLTQDVMMSLPPEKRKGYLLQPQTFLRLQSMVDAILQADGITPEMIEAQRKRGQLINQLLAAGEDEAQLKALVETHKDEIDYEFYHTLTASAEASAAGGDDRFATELLGLRARLLKLHAPADLPSVPAESATPAVSREELVEHLLAAKDDREFEALVVVGRPLIDYQFYLDLANRLEAAEKAGEQDEASRLSALRDRILDLSTKLDEEARAALEQSARLLSDVYEAEDPSAVIASHIDEIDDLFFYLVTSNIEQATREDAQANADEIARLRKIADLAANALEQRMPPRMKLVNRLLRTPAASGREQLLDESPALVDQELVKDIDGLIQQFGPLGQEELIARLTELRALVAGRVGATAAAPESQAEA